MKYETTPIEGLLIIHPDCYGDERGWFMETYNKEKYAQMGITCDFVQDNQSFSAQRGILRGLHFQNAPYAQAKLVRVTAGAVFDVAVDLRPASATYRQWFGVELSAQNKTQFFIPRGFAHGFVTLTDNVEFLYKVDNIYSPPHDRSVRFDDPDIGIHWPAADPVLSEKDRHAPLLKDSDINF